MTSRLGSIRPKEFIKRLKKIGFEIDHQTGSHMILRDNKRHRIVVPCHVKEMKRGLVFGVIKQAGLTIKEFNKLK